MDWEKPLSCHLYPVRIETYGEGPDAIEVINYERIDLCEPAVKHGRRTAVQLGDFLAAPLARKYGDAWADRFKSALAQRRRDVEVGPQDSGIRPQESGCRQAQSADAPVSDPLPSDS